MCSSGASGSHVRRRGGEPLDTVLQDLQIPDETPIPSSGTGSESQVVDPALKHRAGKPSEIVVVPTTSKALFTFTSIRSQRVRATIDPGKSMTKPCQGKAKANACRHPCRFYTLSAIADIRLGVRECSDGPLTREIGLPTILLLLNTT